MYRSRKENTKTKIYMQAVPYCTQHCIVPPIEYWCEPKRLEFTIYKKSTSTIIWILPTSIYWLLHYLEKEKRGQNLATSVEDSLKYGKWNNDCFLLGIKAWTLTPNYFTLALPTIMNMDWYTHKWLNNLIKIMLLQKVKKKTKKHTKLWSITLQYMYYSN